MTSRPVMTITSSTGTVARPHAKSGEGICVYLVFVGLSDASFISDGGTYGPGTQRWRPVNRVGAPSLRGGAMAG